MEFNLAADALIEPSTGIQLGKVEIGNGNSLRIDDLRVYHGQLTEEDLRSILREPEFSLGVKMKNNGVEITVVNPAGKEYAVERNGNFRSPVWDRVFIGDRTRKSQTFVDSAFRARSGVFYRLRFPR